MGHHIIHHHSYELIIDNDAHENKLLCPTTLYDAPTIYIGLRKVILI